MKILYYRQNQKLLPGILTDRGIIEFNKLPGISKKYQFSDTPLTIDDLKEIQKAFSSIPKQALEVLSEAGHEIGPCIPKPSKIICIGLNYRKHAIESGMAIPSVPVA